ncbi:hypothetical protein [Microbacterium sp. NPDC055455]
MAELSQLPGVLDLTIYRGDNTNFQVTLTDTETQEPLVLPEAGWRAQVRVVRASEDVLFTITVDAADAATGVVGLSIAGSDTGSVTVDSAFWDLENTDTDRTYLAGKVRLKGQVSR